MYFVAEKCVKIDFSDAKKNRKKFKFCEYQNLFVYG